MRVPATILVTALLFSPAAVPAEEQDVADVVRRYLEVRGGAERWRALSALELTGIYSAFSFHEPFRLIRKSGDQYRLDYVVLGSPATRARDAVTCASRNVKSEDTNRASRLQPGAQMTPVTTMSRGNFRRLRPACRLTLPIKWTFHSRTPSQSAYPGTPTVIRGAATN